MKELARKGNISIYKDEEAGDYLLYYDDIILINNTLDLEELSDLKDCISKVTAKKWEYTGKTDNTGIPKKFPFICSACRSVSEQAYRFCPNCGIKLEGVEE